MSRLSREVLFSSIALLVAACLLPVGDLSAAEPQQRDEVARRDVRSHVALVRQAERNVEMARLRQRHYIQSEFPLRLRQLNADMKIVDAEIRLLRKRVDAYEYVSHRDRNDYSSPTTVNVRQMENALLAAELEREQVKAERTSLIENDRSRRRLFQLELEAALDELDLLR